VFSFTVSFLVDVAVLSRRGMFFLGLLILRVSILLLLDIRCCCLIGWMVWRFTGGRKCRTNSLGQSVTALFGP